MLDLNLSESLLNSRNILDSIILVLAIWRVTSILQEDRIAKPIRTFVFRATETETQITYPDKWYGYLISCFRCLSFWVSILICLVLWHFVGILVYILALNAGAIILNEYSNRE